jgi:hypothetical protein
VIEASVLLTSEAEREAWLTAPVEEALKLQRSLPNEALRVVATGESKTRSQHSLLTGSRFGAGAESDPSRGAFRKRMGANHCPQTFTTQLSYWRIESPLLATDSSAYRGAGCSKSEPRA